MLATSQKSSTPPPHTVPEDVIKENEPSAPSLSRKRPAEAMEEPVEVPEILEAVLAKKPAPVFQTFESSNKLEDGLCIVRGLGNGKYEIVNVEKVHLDIFASEETGRFVKADDGRLNAIKIDEKVWKSAQFKCSQAVSSASKSIFYFAKLPKELRFRVYDFAIVGARHLRRFWSQDSKPSSTLGLALMRTCKQVYEETLPFFFKNNFRITYMEKNLSTLLPTFRENLIEINFEWFKFERHEVYAFKYFDSCSKLKIFNLSITRWTTETYLDGDQHMYQDVETIRKFNRCRGFDTIVSLRGLEKVRVLNEGSRKATDVGITPAVVKTFEDFLNSIMTQPKHVPPPKPARIKKATRPAKTNKVAKIRKSTRAIREDDFQYDG